MPNDYKWSSKDYLIEQNYEKEIYEEGKHKWGDT